VGPNVDVEIAPTSPGQRTLWLANRFRGGNGLMSVPVLLDLTGRLDVEALQQALGAVIARFASLRTTVELRDRTLVQVIHPVAAVRIALERPDRAITRPEDAYEQIGKMLLTEPDPAICPVQAALWQTGPESHLLALNINHLATDGWSNRIVLSALGAAYSALVESRPPSLPAERTRYADYAAAAWNETAATEAGRRYWNEVLEGARFAELPGPARERASGIRRVRGPRPPALHESIDLAPEEADRLRRTARERRTTPYVLLLDAFMSAVAAMTGQEDLAVGSIFANRAKPELHGTVGMFANLSVLRSRMTEDPEQRLRRLHRSVLGALGHQDLHHALLAYGSDAGVHSGGPQDAVFHMVAEPPNTDAAAGLFSGLEHAELAWPAGLASRFELELVLKPHEAGLAGTFRYAADRLRPDWIARLHTAYEGALTRSLR